MPRIELNHNKIYRAHDLQEISYLFFPQKSANLLRASFIAIFIEIKNSRDQKLTDTAYIAGKYDLPLSSVCKARAKIRKIGLIELRGGLWGFSSRFRKSLGNLSDKIQSLIKSAHNNELKQKEIFLVNLAKGLK